MMDKRIPTESLQDYYNRTGQPVTDLLPVVGDSGHFSVRQTFVPTRKTPFNRRDYYKICLSTAKGKGKGTLVYDDMEIQLNPPCLIFTNPSVPASIEISYHSTSRFGCIFNKQFIESQLSPDVQYASPLFNPSIYPVVNLTEEEKDRLQVYFSEMQRMQESDYPLNGIWCAIFCSSLFTKG